ncbi:AsmA-like C-terminal domain-containing protein [Stappia indica]|uniref:AsmA-like C-terminal domain-containing protein n=1 Tax=Stappia indica TaxID=538381 RepID=UPI001CD536CB|nr:AsmA-like C-terminal domain-containing protein [Stappia indica]MCA1298642.1 AsmA-like C-terminal region-containing protein [Stappia indica]
MLIVLAVGLGVIRAMQGPISIGFAARMIEREVSFNGVALTIGAATVDLSEGLPARLELENAAVELEGARPLSLFLPRISAPLDLVSLLTGRISISEIVLEQPRLELETEPAETTSVPKMSGIAEAMDQIGILAGQQLSRRGISRIEIVSGEVLAEAEETYRISGIDAELTHDEDLTLRMEAEVAGRLGRWRAQALRRVDPETGQRTITLALRDVTIGEFMPVDAELATGRGLGVPIQPTIEVSLDAAGAFQTTRASLIVTPGWINTGRAIVGFDRIDVQLLWEEGRPGFLIAPSVYMRGNTVFPFEGVVEPPRQPGSLWSYRIDSRNGRIGPSDVPGPPFLLENFTAKGRADLRRREVFFDTLVLQSGTASMDGAGSLRLAEDGPYLALAVQSGPMPVATMKRLWPVTMVPPARAWIIEHMIDGRILNGRATVALQPPAFDSQDPDPGWSGNDVRVDIAFADVSLKTIGTIPVAQRLTGTIEVADVMLTVSADSGVMVAGDTDPLDLGRTVFRIPDLRKSGIKTGELELAVSGPAEGLASLIDAEPFLVLSKRDIAPADVSGEGNLDVRARFALEKDVPVEEVDWSVTGALRKFANAEPINGHKLSRANLTFDANANRLELKGTGRLDGLAANLDLVVPFEGPGGEAVASRQGVVLDVTAKELAARGFDLREFITGKLRLATEDTADGMAYDVDLTRARVHLPQVGWIKSQGVPARARFTMYQGEGRRQVRNFELTSEGVDIAGSIDLSEAGGFTGARFDRFALRPSDEASLRISRKGKGYVADFRARRFDGRGLVASFTEGGKGGSGKGAASVQVNAEIDRLTGFNGVVANDVRLRLASSGGNLRSLTLSGKTGARAGFDIALTPGSGGRTLSGEIADTGALLRFTDLYKRMRGGRGVLVMQMPGDKTWHGTFKVRRLSITEDPAIRKLAEVPQVANPEGSQRGLRGAARKGEASFSALDIAFRREGDLLRVTEGTLAGATVGGNISGTVNLASRTLDMTGTFVPIFALNNLFAKIPILGFALGGGSDEGLIGVTYRLSGPVSDPVLTVNPASVMAPGIFRKIFEYR